MLNLTDLCSFNSENELKTFNNMVNKTYLSTIIKEEDLGYLEITPIDSNVFIGDFHGLLKKHGIANELLEITTIMNGLKSSGDFNGNLSFIRIPSSNLIEAVINF